MNHISESVWSRTEIKSQFGLKLKVLFFSRMKKNVVDKDKLRIVVGRHLQQQRQHQQQQKQQQQHFESRQQFLEQQKIILHNEKRTLVRLTF